MSRHKKQVWLRPDQVALVVQCLNLVRDGCLAKPHALHTDTDVLARNFTASQIAEAMKLFGADRT